MVLVDMVVVEHGGGGIKTTWVGRVVGDGGVGVRGRVNAADSWCERSREGSGVSAFWMGTSGSREFSSDGGEGAGDKSWVSMRPRKPQRELEGGR